MHGLIFKLRDEIPAGSTGYMNMINFFTVLRMCHFLKTFQYQQTTNTNSPLPPLPLYYLIDTTFRERNMKSSLLIPIRHEIQLPLFLLRWAYSNGGVGMETPQKTPLIEYTKICDIH